MKIISVVGARPNFMKIAPIANELKKYPSVKHLLVHTGQHYDTNMSKLFFDELEIPKPEINLEVGSGSHAVQTAEIMKKFEKVCLDEKPDLIIVVGDVNSTIACSLVAVKLGIEVAHVEAGLRSFNLKMPEEINRMLTDRIADYLFTTEESGNKNLLNEGIDKEKIFFVGNVMIDTLLKHKETALKSNILDKLKLNRYEYAVLTLHRPSNVDDRENFTKILNALNEISEKIKIIYPMHPRAKKNAEKFNLSLSKLKITEPLGYLDFLNLVINSKFVLTDSGGIQEETTILGIPCITLREETERPITATQGTNVIVGTNKDKIIQESFKIIDGKEKKGSIPKLWDGKSAKRIIEVVIKNKRCK